ncbi:para-nitrobenzyl esterase [Novosphingobium sp. PhB165]|uniref:carboxylesterase family protein n=1 Tax=Novosphingobium sp. PhB165 TaxID=2485105 RepID=UPI0010CE9DAF|nr:carboxylesterase family protein [Novosphingobium sp. PhB165]TCM15390.1 para-nitrobenzyl esterase [Novosphingobium sp. PhB165]
MRLKLGPWACLATGAALIAMAGAASSQPMPTSIGHDRQLLIAALPAKNKAHGLTVTSPAFPAGGDIPLASTQYGDNRFPGLAWSKGPAATRSYVVVVQGMLAADGAPEAGTSIHLVLYNLPAGTTALPAGMTEAPGGAAFGPNVHGAGAAYAGPHTHDAARHAYHVQVFALDTVLSGDLGGNFDALKQAMTGHVLASGELVGFASKPALKSAGTLAATTPIKVESGQLTGAAGRDPDIAVYKGIPYAAPPVGPLRWRAPAAPLAWDGVRKADAFGPACPQPGGEMARGLPQSEDCLALNVWTGAAPGSGEKRPVYVWIYGGGFIGGTGASPEFDGEGLAKKGVVVVTFNYRVGVLGFLATPELSKESGHAASGNYGLLDDVAALQWVQRNIAAFGGDPAKVTIGGQSAGAGSVGFLSMSPLAKGLFRAGIAESHARYPRDTELRYLSVSWRPLATAEKAGEKYAAQHGARSLAELRALPWQKLIEGSATIDADVETGSDGKPPLFRPVVDGWVIPQSYWDTYQSGGQNQIAYVAGNNKDETGAVPETAFAALRASKAPPRAGMPQTNVTVALFEASARRKFGPLAAEFLRLYPATTDEEAALQNNAAARDNSRISTWLWGTLWRKANTLPLHTYFWTHAQPGPSHDTRGAFHGSEIPYAFNSLDAVNLPWTDEDRQIAERMSSYWANIIKTGNPNGPGLPDWPAYSAQVPQVMELGDHFAPIPIASPEKIDFWKRFYATQPAW